MANVCINRLFITAPPATCRDLLADVGLPSSTAAEYELSFAVLVPEPEAAASDAEALSAARSSWRRRHWGTTVDPRTARMRGDEHPGGVDFEFETPEPPLAWVSALAAAHPLARLHLLFDCPDEPRAGEVIYINGSERRRSEVAPSAYESWARESAVDGIYGEHQPPYDRIGLD